MSKLNTIKKTNPGSGSVAAIGRAAGVKSVGSVRFTALAGNTGSVQIGGSQMNGTTIPGIPLAAGATLTFEKGEIDDLAEVYLYVATGGEGVAVTYSTAD